MAVGVPVTRRIRDRDAAGREDRQEPDKENRRCKAPACPKQNAWCHGFDAALVLHVQCNGLIRRQLLQRCDLDTIARMTSAPSNQHRQSRTCNRPRSTCWRRLMPRNARRSLFRLDDDATRTDWGYFPRNFHGLALGAMDAKQQKVAHRLVSYALSLHAYAKVTTIIALDNVLDVHRGAHDAGNPRSRAVLRQHLRRSRVTAVGVPVRGPPRQPQLHARLRTALSRRRRCSWDRTRRRSNMAARRSCACAARRRTPDANCCCRSTPEQRAQAVICEEAPPDFVLMNAARVPERMVTGEAFALAQVRERFDAMSAEHKRALTFEKARPAGLPASAMTPAQRERLDALIAVYIERLPEDLARIERAKIEAAGIDKVHFAWAGSERRRRGALLPAAGAVAPGGVRQHAGRREPHPCRVATILTATSERICFVATSRRTSSPLTSSIDTIAFGAAHRTPQPREPGS